MLHKKVVEQCGQKIYSAVPQELRVSTAAFMYSVAVCGTKNVQEIFVRIIKHALKIYCV